MSKPPHQLSENFAGWKCEKCSAPCRPAVHMIGRDRTDLIGLCATCCPQCNPKDAKEPHAQAKTAR